MTATRLGWLFLPPSLSLVVWRAASWRAALNLDGHLHLLHRLDPARPQAKGIVIVVLFDDASGRCSAGSASVCHAERDDYVAITLRVMMAAPNEPQAGLDRLRLLPRRPQARGIVIVVLFDDASGRCNAGSASVCHAERDDYVAITLRVMMATPNEPQAGLHRLHLHPLHRLGPARPQAKGIVIVVLFDDASGRCSAGSASVCHAERDDYVAITLRVMMSTPNEPQSGLHRLHLHPLRPRARVIVIVVLFDDASGRCNAGSASVCHAERDDYDSHHAPRDDGDTKRAASRSTSPASASATSARPCASASQGHCDRRSLR